jgi:hypothetical protein
LLVSQLLSAYRYCALSNEVLRKPIVADGMGRLYCKEKILEYLIEQKKRDKEEGAKGKKDQKMNIKSLNEVQLVNVDIDIEQGILKCPASNITIDLNKDTDVKLADAQFSYIVPCGCTMNAKMLNELVGLKTSDMLTEKSMHKCPSCGGSFDARDIIPISASLIDNRLKERLQERLTRLTSEGLYHNLKPRKMRNKRKHDANEEGKQLKRKKQ